MGIEDFTANDTDSSILCIIDHFPKPLSILGLKSVQENKLCLPTLLSDIVDMLNRRPDKTNIRIFSQLLQLCKLDIIIRSRNYCNRRQIKTIINFVCAQIIEHSYIARNATSFKCSLYSFPTSFICIHFTCRITGHRTRQSAPMIQHFRNMMNPHSLFSRSKNEIIILAAIEFAPQRPNFI